MHEACQRLIQINARFWCRTDGGQRLDEPVQTGPGFAWIRL